MRYLLYDSNSLGYDLRDFEAVLEFVLQHPNDNVYVCTDARNIPLFQATRAASRIRYYGYPARTDPGIFLDILCNHLSIPSDEMISFSGVHECIDKTRECLPSGFLVPYEPYFHLPTDVVAELVPIVERFVELVKPYRAAFLLVSGLKMVSDVGDTLDERVEEGRRQTYPLDDIAKIIERLAEPARILGRVLVPICIQYGDPDEVQAALERMNSSVKLPVPVQWVGEVDWTDDILHQAAFYRALQLVASRGSIPLMTLGNASTYGHLLLATLGNINQMVVCLHNFAEEHLRDGRTYWEELGQKLPFLKILRQTEPGRWHEVNRQAESVLRCTLQKTIVDTSMVAISYLLSDVSCLRCGKQHLSIHVPPRLGEPRAECTPEGTMIIGGQSIVASTTWIEECTVWTRGAPYEMLVSPTLRHAVEKTRYDLRAFTSLVAHVFRQVQVCGDDVCSSTIFVNDHTCTYLTIISDNSVGLVSIADISLAPPLSKERRAKARLPIQTELLEASPKEPTMSVAEVRTCTDWDPRTCENLRPSRPWTHLVLVSHRWGHPDRPTTLWKNVQKEVETEVQRIIKNSEKDDRVRIESVEDDIGVWVDFMMVPNSHHDDGRGVCQRCAEIKRSMIQRIGALLTIATVIPMSPEASDRGWILQELTLDAHGRTPFEHRDRISLMAHRVRFSEDGKGSGEDDGLLLRCGEFVRLTQTPRVWPSVNRALLDIWAAEGQIDEKSGSAWATLTRYARTFDLPCHTLKREMAVRSQEIAMVSPEESGAGSRALPIDLTALCDAVEEQAVAMRDLADRINTDMALVRFPIDKRVILTAQLQWQLFATTAMGLRSEWWTGDGLAGWVHASAIAESLGAVKFLARLREGEIRFSEATSVTLAKEPRPLPERFSFATRIIQQGFRASDLHDIYTLDCESTPQG